MLCPLLFSIGKLRCFSAPWKSGQYLAEKFFMPFLDGTWRCDFAGVLKSFWKLLEVVEKTLCHTWDFEHSHENIKPPCPPFWLHSTATSTIYHSCRRLQAACLVVVIVHSESSSDKAGRQWWLVYMYFFSTKAASSSVAICRYDPCNAGSLLSWYLLYRSARDYYITRFP
jgi:hypothetical protein